MKTAILTVLNAFKPRASIIILSVTLTAYILFIILMYISVSVLLVFKCLNELTNCSSISEGVNEHLKISGDVLIDKDQLILNTLNVD